MRHDGRVGELEDALAADPANLDIAWAYWHALGSWHGCDIRSGGYVVRAFRAAALQSPQGVLAFAQAYRQLFALSSEGPRNLDPALTQCAEAALKVLAQDERAVVEWLLATARRK